MMRRAAGLAILALTLAAGAARGAAERPLQPPGQTLPMTPARTLQIDAPWGHPHKTLPRLKSHSFCVVKASRCPPGQGPIVSDGVRASLSPEKIGWGTRTRT